MHNRNRELDSCRRESFGCGFGPHSKKMRRKIKLNVRHFQLKMSLETFCKIRNGNETLSSLFVANIFLFIIAVIRH